MSGYCSAKLANMSGNCYECVQTSAGAYNQ